MRKTESAETDSDQRNTLNVLTLALGLIASGVMGYLAAKYWNSATAYDAALARYALMLSLFGIAGLAIVNWQDPNTSVKWELRPLDAKYLSQLGMRLLLVLVIGVLLEAAIAYASQLELVKSTVAREDLAAYYVFAGACEELFFRGVICNLLARYVNKYVGIFASSLAFMAAHSEVYGSQWTLMLVQFILGIIWGFAYIYWKDITPNLGAHVIKNLLAVGNLFVW